MKKIISIALVLVMCVVLLVSCVETPIDDTYNSYEKGNSDIGNRLVCLYKHNDDISIYVDKETRVQYMIMRGMECCAIEIMVGADGNPLLYEGNLEVTENE